MLNVHFNLSLILKPQTHQLRDSVNCILTCIRSKQIKKQKKKKKKRPSSVILVSSENHAVCFIIIILEYNRLFLAMVLQWTLPLSPTKRDREAQSKPTVLKIRIWEYMQFWSIFLDSWHLINPGLNWIMRCPSVRRLILTVFLCDVGHIQSVGHFTGVSRLTEDRCPDTFTSFTCYSFQRCYMCFFFCN